MRKKKAYKNTNNKARLRNKSTGEMEVIFAQDAEAMEIRENYLIKHPYKCIGEYKGKQCNADMFLSGIASENVSPYFKTLISGEGHIRNCPYNPKTPKGVSIAASWELDDNSISYLITRLIRKGGKAASKEASKLEAETLEKLMQSGGQSSDMSGHSDDGSSGSGMSDNNSKAGSSVPDKLAAKEKKQKLQALIGQLDTLIKAYNLICTISVDKKLGDNCFIRECVFNSDTCEDFRSDCKKFEEYNVMALACKVIDRDGLYARIKTLCSNGKSPLGEDTYILQDPFEYSGKKRLYFLLDIKPYASRLIHNKIAKAKKKNSKYFLLGCAWEAFEDDSMICIKGDIWHTSQLEIWNTKDYAQYEDKLRRYDD